MLQKHATTVMPVAGQSKRGVQPAHVYVLAIQPGERQPCTRAGCFQGGHSMAGELLFSMLQLHVASYAGVWITSTCIVLALGVYHLCPAVNCLTPPYRTST